jgi:hypothetical protein
MLTRAWRILAESGSRRHAARVLQSLGRNREALDMLRPIYAWFTEGFDTRDLKEPKR